MTADLHVRPFAEADAPAWDSFCEGCANATFLHTRRFLSYHGGRFRDASCIVEGAKGWLGVLPAATHPDDADCVVSHPGISYGGLLNSGTLGGEEHLSAFAAIAGHYLQLGYKRFHYKAIPHIYQMTPAQDDLYSLFRLGARRYRCDLASCIDLEARRPPAERRRRNLRKARNAGLKIHEGTENLPRFWPMLVENLARRHDARPVHTLDEIADLAARFPRHIHLVCAESVGEFVAGVVVFRSRRVHHAQYIAASIVGQNLAALDLVFEHCIATAGQKVRYFDFGISTEAAGWRLNSGLHRFKTEFGGGGIVAEFYELDLEKDIHVPP